MSILSEIEPGFPVLSSDGQPLGRVAESRGSGFRILRVGSGNTTPQIEASEVARVDGGQVHLRSDEAALLRRWKGAGAAAPGQRSGLRRLWPLLIGLALIALLLFGLSRWSGDSPDRSGGNSGGAESASAAGRQGSDAAAGAMVQSVEAFLASPEPAPRSFAFDRLNFDPASPSLREADRPTLSALADVLTRYPSVRVRIVGYADAQGGEGANARLGKQRAESVAQALRQAGIEISRLETASGGEDDPRASNALPSGRFENRRTELVIIRK